LVAAPLPQFRAPGDVAFNAARTIVSLSIASIFIPVGAIV
jgi:hypothetical protein